LSPHAAAPANAGKANETTRAVITLERLRRLFSADMGDLAVRQGNDFLHTVPASVFALQDMKQVGGIMLSDWQKRAGPDGEAIIAAYAQSDKAASKAKK
jgi:hypothetical protein